MQGVYTKYKEAASYTTSCPTMSSITHISKKINPSYAKILYCIHIVHIQAIHLHPLRNLAC